MVETALPLSSWWLETSSSFAAAAAAAAADVAAAGHNNSLSLLSKFQTSSCVQPSFRPEFGFPAFRCLSSFLCIQLVQTKKCLKIKWAGSPKKTERAWDCLKLHEVSVDEPLWGCLAVVHWHGTARKPLTSVMLIFCLCNIYSSNADNWKYLKINEFYLLLSQSGDVTLCHGTVSKHLSSLFTCWQSKCWPF